MKATQFVSKKGFVLLATAAITGATILTGCGKKGGDASQDNISRAVESLVGSAVSAMDDSEQSDSLSSSSARIDLSAAENATACGLSRFSPLLGSASCAGSEDNKTVLSTFSGCTVGRSDEVAVNGQVKLSFDSAATCDSWIQAAAFPTSGSLLRTTDSLVFSFEGGNVTYTTNARENYLDEEVSGGVRTTFNNGSRSIDFIGLNRSIVYRGFEFEHSIRSTAPIVVVGTKLSNSRSISSGAIRVDDNKHDFSVVASMSGLSWNSGCCHPVAGEISAELSGSRTGTIKANFATGTCGVADITYPDGSVVAKQLSSCE